MNDLIPISRAEGPIRMDGESLYEIDVRLFNDMTNLGQVYIIRNRKRPEILSLENETTDD